MWWMEDVDTWNRKFGFSLLIKFSPLQPTETNENNDFTTMIDTNLGLFCALLNIYNSHRGQLNYLLVLILVELHLKLGPDVDYNE